MLDKSVIDKLRRFSWSNYGIYYAVLFGSIIRRGFGEDIDIAVEFVGGLDLGKYSRLLFDLFDYLDTDKVDLVPIGDSTDCYLIHEVFGDGVILYMAGDDAWLRMHRRASICEDFLIDARKLDLVGNAGRALVMR
ncbi:MAG: nucleotidyltransferase family protein [Vulcanisaeta sp.]